MEIEESIFLNQGQVDSLQKIVEAFEAMRLLFLEVAEHILGLLDQFHVLRKNRKKPWRMQNKNGLNSQERHREQVRLKVHKRKRRK